MIRAEIPTRGGPGDWRESQVGGDHYQSMNFQPIEFILANGLGFVEGNVLKYLCRYKQKGGLEDLAKAKHYIELLIQHETGAIDGEG